MTTETADPLIAVETQLADRERKLKARKGKREYRDNVPLLETEIARLRGVREMILDARKRETER